MNIVTFLLFVWCAAISAAASGDGISVHLINGLDSSITIPALRGLMLSPGQSQEVVLPTGSIELSFLYHNVLNGDVEVHQKVEAIQLLPIFAGCQLRLEHDKDDVVILKCNGLQLHELKAGQKFSRQHTQPLLQQVASVDSVRTALRKQSKYRSLQQLRK